MSEAGLLMDGSRVLQLQQEDFHQFQKPEVVDLLSKYPCYVYMLVRRPKIALDPASLQVKTDAIRGTLLIQDSNGKREQTFTLTNNGEQPAVTASSPYPHNFLFLFDIDQKPILNAKVSLLAQGLGIRELRDDLAFEIMYIGQAYGEDGNRTPADRLQKHETLQAIYSKTIARTPDHEIWILLLHFTPQSVLSFDGRSGFAVSDEEDDAHMKLFSKCRLQTNK